VKTKSVTEVARHFSAMLDVVEHDQDAITRQDAVYLSPIDIAEVAFGLHLLRSGSRCRES
jgi:hypothetical protein